jgi:glycosyltransferase involved in cell wall biosynthesis
MDDINHGRTPPPRPRVLLLAAACNPYKGSDFIQGWERALGTATRFDTWVICGHWDRADITRYLAEHGEIPGLRFYFLEPCWQEERLKTRRPLFYTHFIPYHLWHRRAFHVAERLHREVKFHLVHQVTLVGYWEPGYLWRLSAPFIWGPVGGTQNYPWRFLGLAGPAGALKEIVRTILNIWQFRFSPRVRRAVRRARCLIVSTSHGQRDFTRVYGFTPPVLLDAGVAAVSSKPLEKSSPDSPLRILWSGEFISRKGLPLLLMALARLPREVTFELRILGDGPLRRRWLRLAHSLGLAPRCQWLGWLSYHEALKQYDWSQLLVFTSLRDTSGNVVLEALSRGVPVVCLDHHGMRDIVTAECGIKIPVTTPGEVTTTLRDHLVALATDRARLESLSRGALKRAGRFLWSHNGEQMARIYFSVLEADQTDTAMHQDRPDDESRILGGR